MPSSSSIPSSSLFLSGEGDLDIAQNRELRLRSMTALRDSDSKHGTDVGNRGDKFRIEVINSEGTAGNDQVDDHEDLHGTPIEGDDDDDDDNGSWSCPPPICGVKPENNLHATNPSTESKIHQCYGNNNSQKSPELLSDSSPSLMERMMAEASLARNLRKNEQEVTERNRVTKASFGMKKGFLNNSSRRNDGGKQKKRQSSIPKTNVCSTVAKERSGDRLEKEQTPRKEEPIFELDDEGNMIPLPTPKQTPTNCQQQIYQEEIQTLRPNSNTTTTTTNSNPLRFQEVQDALHQHSSTLTPNLMEKLSENPKLMERLSDPETSEVLEALKEDPKGAMGRYKDRPEVMEFLGEFCGAIGECFSDLGAEQEKEENEKKDKEKEEVQRREEQKQKQNELGPMAKEALRKEEKRKMDGGKAWDEDLSHKEREKLDGIVADRDVTAMLMDPDTQRVMQECSLPGRMHMYMQHPEYGPKLKKMIEVGLLKVA